MTSTTTTQKRQTESGKSADTNNAVELSSAEIQETKQKVIDILGGMVLRGELSLPRDYLESPVRIPVYYVRRLEAYADENDLKLPDAIGQIVMKELDLLTAPNKTCFAGLGLEPLSRNTYSKLSPQNCGRCSNITFSICRCCSYNPFLTPNFREEQA
jgi:hypothetical protein